MHVHVWEFKSSKIASSFFGKKKEMFKYSCRCGEEKVDTLVYPNKEVEIKNAGKICREC